MSDPLADKETKEDGLLLKADDNDDGDNNNNTTTTTPVSTPHQNHHASNTTSTTPPLAAASPLESPPKRLFSWSNNNHHHKDPLLANPATTDPNHDDCHYYDYYYNAKQWMDEWTSKGLNEYISLPMICVLGDTSSGKSSVVSSLLGLELPAASQLTTKCPVLIQVLPMTTSGIINNNNNNARCTIQISWHHNNDNDNDNNTSSSLSKNTSPRHRKRSIEHQVQAQNHQNLTLPEAPPPPPPPPPKFSPIVLKYTGDNDNNNNNNDDRDEEYEYFQREIPKAIQQAQEVILTFRRMVVVAPDVILVTFHSKHKWNNHSQALTLVDLPGLVQFQHDHSHQLLEQVTKVMQYYISNPRTILVPVVAAPSHVHNSQVLQWTRDVDPTGSRTIPVMTKIDLMDPGSESEMYDFVASCQKKKKYPHGVYLVKNRGQASLDAGMTWKEGLLEEAQYFETTMPWNTLPKNNIGIPALQTQLANVLVQVMKQSLPDVLSELQQLYKETQQEFESMGQFLITKTDQRKFYHALTQQLIGHVASYLSGKKQHFQKKKKKKTKKTNTTLRTTESLLVSQTSRLVGPNDNHPSEHNNNNMTSPLSSPSMTSPPSNGATKITTTTGTHNHSSTSTPLPSSLPPPLRSSSSASSISNTTTNTTPKQQHQQQQPQKGGAAKLHDACNLFCTEIQSGGLATICKLTEGTLVLVSHHYCGISNGGTRNGDIKGELVHVDWQAQYACVDFIHDQDHSTDVLFDGIGYKADSLDDFQEDEVWSDGSRVFIGREHGVFDSLRKLPLHRVRTDPEWLQDKMEQFRTDDLACFINVDMFQHIVAEFVQDDWAPSCHKLLDTTQTILEDAVQNAMDASSSSSFSFSSHDMENNFERFPLLKHMIVTTCQNVMRDLLDHARAQVKEHLELEEEHPYTQDEIMLNAMNQARFQNLKNDLQLQLRLDQEGVVYDTQAIQTILDRVFAKHSSSSNSQRNRNNYFMAEQMELVLHCYGQVATQRVLDRTPQICWQTCRNLAGMLQEALGGCVTDDVLERCLEESPQRKRRYLALQEKLFDLETAMNVIQSIR